MTQPLKTRSAAAAALIGIALLLPSVAQAELFVSPLDVPNSALTGFGPFGTVTVDLVNPTTATVTFQTNSGFMFLGENAFNLNVNAATFTEAINSFSQSAAGGFGAPSC